MIGRKVNREREIEVGNEKPFRPTKHIRQPTNATYEHMQDFVQVEKNFRDEENPRDVVIGPRNMLTNPPKKGAVGKNITFGGNIPYIEDDYMRLKKLATEDRLKGKALEQDKPFSQQAKKTHVFNTNKSVIGEDRPIPNRPLKEKPGPLMEHDKAFKPSHPARSGQINKSMSPYPTYMENPMKSVERKMPDESDDKPKFKPTHIGKSRPTPSVSTNIRNLKASFPSVFRR